MMVERGFYSARKVQTVGIWTCFRFFFFSFCFSSYQMITRIKVVEMAKGVQGGQAIAKRFYKEDDWCLYDITS
jgi:hypothetical protein